MENSLERKIGSGKQGQGSGNNIVLPKPQVNQ